MLCKQSIIAVLIPVCLFGVLMGCRAPSGNEELTLDPFIARRPAQAPLQKQTQTAAPTIQLASALGLERLPVIGDSQIVPGHAVVQQAVAFGEPARGAKFVTHNEPARFEPTLAASGAEPEQSSTSGQIVVSHTLSNPAANESNLENVHPIDLANALALGGASSLQIQLAREKTLESEADLLKARAMWLPSLRFGLGYTRHDGQIQSTPGPVIQSGRNSFFFGGGAGLGNASLLGGAGGPPRLMVNLSLADAYFEPMIAESELDATDFAESVVINDELLAVATAYFDLVESHSQRANAQAALKAAEEMVNLTSLFAREGAGSQAEADRARAEQTRWRLAVEDAKRVINRRSAELVRLTRLDGHLDLIPAEDQVTPLTVVPSGMPREALLAQGLSSRPEISQYDWVVDAAIGRMRQECWRPWLPNLQVGASGGTFGGGHGDTFTNQAGRGDVEVVAVWELQNLGLGNRALRARRESQLSAAETEAEAIRDQIIAEITTASGDVASYRRQMDAAHEGVEAAENSYRRNFQRVREGEGLPLELLQAIRARATAQNDYAHAVLSYNRAQYSLLRAIGQSPETIPMEVISPE